MTPEMERLRSIKTFPSLVKYLRDTLGWPIDSDNVDELTFDYEPEEIGLDAKSAAKVRSIKQLRPFPGEEVWGIFYVDFEPKRLPVVVLRRILQALVVKKRQTAAKSQMKTWRLHDLLFINSYGEGDERAITFAHFKDDEAGSLPTLKVVGWDAQDTALHMDQCENELARLRYDEDLTADEWRKEWSAAFTLEHREVITTSKALAEAMAELAGRIRKRVNAVLKIESDGGPIKKLHKAFRQTLIHDLSEDDFADMYAQTITYGLFSARCSRDADLVAENLGDMIPVTNPFLKELLATFLTIGGRKGKIDFDELGINDVVEMLRDANIEAVKSDFGDKNPQHDPVIHFYEDFLKQYDAQKKTQRGVFYTPKPVVSFIIRSVHDVLQKEFGLEDGLAATTTWGQMLAKHPEMKLPTITVRNAKTRKEEQVAISEKEPFVKILDPAAGTGTFLVEVIDIIHRTMQKRWEKEGHMPLEFGRLWNRYVPKHLLPRLYGFELMMAPYAIAHMKIGLKLFETGYKFGAEERARIYLTNSLEPAQDFSDTFEQMAPALAHEAQAVNAVKRLERFTVITGNPPYSNFGQLNKIPFILRLLEDYKRGLDEKKINLDDDFIKFIRYSQSLIQQTGVGILGLITNNVFLDGITHRRMRQALVECFDYLRLTDLHGSIQKQERSPDGREDENVFDIKQGVAVSICSATSRRRPRPVYLSNVYGDRVSKYAQLSQATPSVSHVSEVIPQAPDFFFKVAINPYRAEYESGWSVPAMMPFYNSGIQTKKDSLTIHYTRGDLERVLLDLKERDVEWLRQHYELGPDGRDWATKWAKEDVSESKGQMFRVQYRPFDFRWSYFTGNSKGFIAYPRKDLTRGLLSGNVAFATMRQVAGVADECEAFATAVPMTDRSMYSTLGTPYLFPLYVNASDGALIPNSRKQPNYTDEFLVSLSRALNQTREGEYGLPTGLTPEDIFHYVYGVFHSPGYRSRYAEFLKSDFPRLPLTSSIGLFRLLAKLGGELVSLHLMESKKLDKHITKPVGPTHPEVEKVSYSDRTVWIDKAQTAGFSGVPENVWEFHIGGYQVCQKWLKDRKGRKLSKADIEHYQKIVVALSETIRIMKEMDAVIESHGGWPAAFAPGNSAYGGDGRTANT